MKKIVGFICAAAVAACCAFSFTGCGTAEVVYKISDDGTYYILSGVSGNAGALKECVIASSYDDGEHGELPVTHIGKEAFMGCTSLLSVEIPDTVTYIDSRAFAYNNILSLEIPDSVTYIGYASFACSYSISELVIPESVEELGPYAFAYCSSLEKVTVNANIETIYANTFAGSYISTETGVYYDTKLVEISLPSTLKKIHKTALMGNFIKDIYFDGNAEQWKAVDFFEVEEHEDDDGQTVVEEILLSESEKIQFLKNVTVHCSDFVLSYQDGNLTQTPV